MKHHSTVCVFTTSDHIFFLYLADLPLECNNIQQRRRETIVTAYSTLLVVTGICALLFTPLFKKHLQLTKFILILLQMITVLFFLIIGVVIYTVFNSSFLNYMQNVVGDRDELNAKDVVIRKKVLSFFKSVSYLLYYFLSLMQSFDLYTMICNPFQYANLVEKNLIWKYIGWGCLLCLVLASDDLWIVAVALYWFQDNKMYMDHFDTYNQIADNIDKFTIGKLTLIKIVYAVAIFKISWKTKKALEESSKMAGSKTKTKLHRRLFYFSLIPFFLNIAFSIPEAITVLNQRRETTLNLNCLTESWYQRDDVKNILMGLALPIAVISYIVAYLIIFPKLRGSFICKGNGNN